MVSVKRSTLSLPECLIESCKLALSFESADQIQKGIWRFGRNLLLAKFGSERVKYYSMFSLRRRRNQTPVSNVFKVAPISLFWAANGLNNLPEMRFRFPFNLIGKWTMAFLTVQSWRVLKSWYTGGGPEQGFRRWFADVTNRCLVSSVAQATVGYNFNKDWRVYCGALFSFLRVLIFAIWRIFTSRKIRSQLCSFIYSWSFYGRLMLMHYCYFSGSRRHQSEQQRCIIWTEFPSRLQDK